MKVQVLNALATVRADIGHNAVAALDDAQLFAQLRNDRVDVAQQRGDILGYQQRFTALPIRGKYIATLYSEKAAASGGTDSGSEEETGK